MVNGRLAGGKAMRIIVVALRKGGSGKTTLAGHLGVQAEREGIGKVALADMDPQGNLADWWNLRPGPSPHFLQTTAQGLAEDVAELRRLGFGLLIIDTPPAHRVRPRRSRRCGDIWTGASSALRAGGA